MVNLPNICSNRRERERESRRNAILDAAQQIVADAGYSELTMNAVAKRAELSKGALYLYFANKDALCAAIAHREMLNVSPRVQAAINQHELGIDQVRAMLTVYAEHFQEEPHLFRFSVSWMIAEPSLDSESDAFAAYRASVGEIMEVALNAIRHGQQDGSIQASIDPLLLSIQLWTSLLGVCLAYIGQENFKKRFPLPINLDPLISFHLDHVFRAVAGPSVSENTHKQQPGKHS